MSRNIPSVRLWRVRYTDKETGLTIRDVMVDSINKRLARWKANDIVCDQPWYFGSHVSVSVAKKEQAILERIRADIGRGITGGR